MATDQYDVCDTSGIEGQFYRVADQTRFEISATALAMGAQAEAGSNGGARRVWQERQSIRLIVRTTAL